MQHQPARTYENEYGKQITSVDHRAGWDATFSAPKSVSLTVLVGGDLRVREARHSRTATTTDVYMQEMPEGVRATVDSIHRELKSEGSSKRRKKSRGASVRSPENLVGSNNRS